MSHTNWQKSSFSEGQGDNCVELAAVDHGIHMRESDEPDTVLRTTPATLRSFIRAVKAGGLGHII
ncbi:hypothetical protein SBI_05962 [Streptomyces bingchenggensis BCW-1]|uniref:DUF397 domain-containing protein n=1 Tax=Streptomyces bingchenggensis (strain BCW-1) TaxID=749414 RepID=D7CGH8_STRBB|nr:MULTISPECIES: DUF397 domain-containing protein [Streptomyces]ADI09082.1 hypothetical protein SBI_05962 [Streptomyces bingchenggensis BCW-1]